MDKELTVAYLTDREGIPWPADDPDRAPRHLLVETVPVRGELTEFWFGPAVPDQQTRRARATGAPDAPSALVRAYVREDTVSKQEKPKPKPKQAKQLLDSDVWHDKRYFSTKPPHDVVRTERCSCAGAGGRGWCNGGHERP